MQRSALGAAARAALVSIVTTGALFAGGSATTLPDAAPDTGNPAAAIEDATRQFASTGKAPVLERGDSVIYPFGESQPTLQCTPLRACDVELEAGEVVHGVALGDTERWLTSPLYSGDPAAPVPHVVVKPREHGIATNLIVTTTRRTYHLDLVSPAKGKGSDAASYLRRVRFYYPRDLVESWSNAASSEAAKLARREAATVASLTGAIRPGSLNFDYELSGGRTLPFRPTVVFDDGHHTYLQLPEGAASSDAPAFLATTDGGEPAILNYRMNGSWIVVDGLFARGELVSGVGRAKRSVRIVNRGFARLGGRRR